MNPDLNDYNYQLAAKWSNSASKINSELLFCVTVKTEKPHEVNVMWDNSRGNINLLETMKEIVKMLEKNQKINFSTNNKNNE